MIPLLLALALQGQEPVRVTAHLSAEQIEAGETTTFRVEVETGGARAVIRTFPALPPGLDLVGTRDSDHRQFSLPGGTRRFITREFVLRSRVPGRYRIPAVEVSVDDRTYSSPSLLLVVTSSRATAAPDMAPPGGPDGVRIQAWLGVDTAYVGEQVTLNVEASFSQEARLRLRRPPEYEAPSPTGFWVHDITGRRAPSTRIQAGRAFEVQTFRRALFPITPGRHEIPPARLLYEMRRGILQAPETFRVESDPLPLVVLPIPTAGRPEGYTGAVGRYEARGWIEPTRVPAGEPVVLTIEVSGTGDLKTLPPPALPAMSAMEVSPPGEHTETEIRGDRLAGTKRFTWILIPREAGDAGIPQIRYPYFDPERRRFDAATIPPLALTVEPAPAGAGGRAVAALRYVKTRPAPESRLRWVRSPWFATAQLAPLLLVAGAIGLRRRREAAPRPSSRWLRRRRRAEIRRLVALAGAGERDVLGPAAAVARSWLAARLGLESAREALWDDALIAAGVATATVADLHSVLQRMAEVRYAPMTPPAAEIGELLLGLDAVLDRVDRETRRGRGATRGGRSVAGAVLLLMAWTAAGHGQAGAFSEGVSHFDQGRAADAARLFDRYVDVRPLDPAGWYNLGTSYHHAGHRGYAIWALLNAARLDPRDPDVRQNLRAVGATPELVRLSAPRLPLRAEELALLASLAWLVAGVAGAGLILRRRAGLGIVAVLALTVAAGAVGLAWEADRAPRTAVVLEPTTLRAAPTLAGEGLARLEPGTGVVPVGSRADWVRARTLDGVEGWVEGGVVGRIGRP